MFPNYENMGEMRMKSSRVLSFSSPSSVMQVTLFHFEDRPRADSVNVIKSLQDEGHLRIMMLTGDHELSAHRVAKAVGIKEVHCSLKPEDKLYHVTTISRDTGMTF